MEYVLYLLIGITIMLFALQSVQLKLIPARGFLQNVLNTAAICLVAGISLCTWILWSNEPCDAPTKYLGVLFGITFSISICAYSYAMKIGPLSYTSFFYSASMIIPAVAGLLIWKEPVTLYGILGVILFLSAFYFICLNRGKDSSWKASAAWMGSSFLSFVLSGFSSLLIKMHQTRMNGEQFVSFIGIGLFVAGIVSLAGYAGGIIYSRNRVEDLDIIRHLKKNWRRILLIALCTGVGNITYAYVAARVQSMYVFPLISGGNMLLATIFSVVFLKENFSKRGFVGIACGLLAIIVLNI